MISTVLPFAVTKEACNGCGLCVDDCPTNLIELDDSGVPQASAEGEAACLFCQHCLAICPEGAVSVRGVRPENSLTLTPELLPKFDQMDHLVRARRSVRQYRAANVAPELIQRLLDAISHAPTGVNARQLTFTVIEDKDVMAGLRARAVETISDAMASGPLPTRAQFLAHVVQVWRKANRDVIFRHAPHLLVVSSPPTTPCPQQDVALALAYFELLAQSAGLGTLWCGYLKVLFEALPVLKPLLSIAEGHVYYAMLFGYPAVKYARTVQREGTARVHRVSSIPLE